MSIGFLNLSIENMNKLFLYSIHDAQGRCMYVGFDTLPHAVSFAQTRGNAEMDVAATYQVRIHQSFEHSERIKAVNAVGALIKSIHHPSLQPAWNVTHHVNRALEVVCEQTGQRYKSASAAASALGISQSRMSQHLARKAGHRSIYGQTFKYVNHYKQQESLERAGLLRHVKQTLASGAPVPSVGAWEQTNADGSVSFWVDGVEVSRRES